MANRLPATRSAKNCTVSICIDPEFKAKLQAAAEKENRTMSNYLENLIRREFEKGSDSHEKI